MGMKHWLAGVAVAAFAAVGAYVYLDTGRTAAPESTIVLLDGSSQTTADLRGKVTLVNFWATSCTTCVAEMPEIIATHQKFNSRGFDTIAVAMSYDPPSYVVNFAETRKLPFKVAIDNTGARRVGQRGVRHGKRRAIGITAQQRECQRRTRQFNGAHRVVGLAGQHDLQGRIGHRHTAPIQRRAASGQGHGQRCAGNNHPSCFHAAIIGSSPGARLNFLPPTRLHPFAGC